MRKGTYATGQAASRSALTATAPSCQSEGFRSGTGMFAVGLVRPKTRANVGAALRAAGCYGASMVAIEGSRCHGDVASTPTDTMKAYRRIPTVLVDDLFDAHPVGCVPVAVDLVEGAVSLFDFVHPKRALYVFGPEDGTLGKRHLDRCAHRVFVPTLGCMNLAATVNVVLYDRLAKAARPSFQRITEPADVAAGHHIRTSTGGPQPHHKEPGHEA